MIIKFKNFWLYFTKTKFNEHYLRKIFFCQNNVFKQVKLYKMLMILKKLLINMVLPFKSLSIKIFNIVFSFNVSSK